MRMDEAWREAAATALGLGLLPLAPGTWASAAAALIYAGMARLAAHVWLEAAAVAAALACVCGGVALWPWARRRYGSEDPRQFVLDEVAGQWLACGLGIRLAALTLGPGGVGLLWGMPFVAFRVFDIWKPPPLRRLERLGGGWGVMLDDVGAGIYAAAATWAAAAVWKALGA